MGETASQCVIDTLLSAFTGESAGKELTMLMGDKTETMDEILHSIRIDGAQEEDLSGVDVSDTYKL